MHHIILIIAVVILVWTGSCLLPRQSARRNRIQLILAWSSSAAVLIFGILLLVNLTAARGDGALSCLSPLVEPFSNLGEDILNTAVNPPNRIWTVLLAVIFIGCLLLIIRDKKAAGGVTSSWLAVGSGLLAITCWGELNPLNYWIFCSLGAGLAISSDWWGRKKRPDIILLNRQAAIIGLGMILLLGIILRFYRIDLQPAALLDYEGTTGLSGIEIMEGNRNYHRLLWSFIARPIMNTYSVPFFAFPLSILFRIFGVSVITLRSLSALFGTITIAAIFALVRQRGSRLLALLSAFFMAISIWQIVISRVGLALSLTPLYAIIIGWLLLKAFESRRWRYYFLSGIGLGCYWLFYMVGKIMLPVSAALIFHQIILAKGFIKRHWPGLTIFILVILLISILSGLGPGEWLLGTGKQARNFIWQREGANSAYTSEINYPWAGRYLIENIQKSFRYLFLRSHHEFLLPPKLPFISPLLFPFFVMGLFYSIFRWKRDLNFFFVALFLTAFIPQIIFATFQDKASLRHLMLIIPSFSYFTALPFYLLARGLSKDGRLADRITAGIVIFPLLIFFLSGSFSITFLSPHWEYRVCRMRRESGEFIRGHLDQYYFFIVRAKGPLYLQNRIIDFITYPKVRSLHYHIPDDYPRPGESGRGRLEGYTYIQPEELPAIFNELGKTIPRAGFIFEQKELVSVFEEKFGTGSVRQRALSCLPWTYYTLLYPPEPQSKRRYHQAD